MTRRLKVLVAAYACDPTRGSEPGVGWGWVRALARHHDLSVLTSELFRPGIEQELRREPELRAHLAFHYVPRRGYLRLSRFWKPANLWTYRCWQKDAYRLALELHHQVRFDLVHQLTWVTFREPGYLWKLGVPFVWGPVGGLENTPWRLLPMLGLRGFAHYACRNAINSLHRRLLVRPRRAFRKASGAIIAATEGIRRQIMQHYGEDSQVICETGPPEPIAAAHSIRRDDEPLRISWSGSHDPGKALPLLLRALARLPGTVAWELHVLGDGPCSAKWQRVARELGIDNRCTWHGRVSREQAIALLGGSHVFALTSVKDLTTTVVMEALSQGVPVVCLDRCGFSDVVTPECGVKIPVERPARMVGRLAEAIGGLWAQEANRRKLAAGALERVRLFTFARKAEAVTELYERALASGQRVSRPGRAPGGHVKHFRLPRKLVDREAYILAACAGKRVLHLGCVGYVRTGDWLARVADERWLHRRIRSVASETIGIDIERRVVEELRDRMGMTDIRWGDAQDLAALDCGRFDVVVAGEIIEHLPNPGRMLESARTVLREDGHLIVTAPNAFCARRALRVLLGTESTHEDHVAYYSHQTLQRLATVSGYRVVDQCSYRLPNRRPLLPYVIERFACLLSPNLCEGVICTMQPK